MSLWQKEARGVTGAWSWKRILWSLRKARLPIKCADLVLDVGSGSNPHPAADVLLERYIDQKHRYDQLVADRPTVLADACKMPFRDKAFDYIIAFHVLEHMKTPEAFLNEMVRVSRAGYIETPNALFERIVPYDVHLLEVMNIDGTLVIHKKTSPRPDPFLNELNLVDQSPAWKRFFYGNPELFHVRYFWEGQIKFKVVNPEVSCDWFVEPVSQKLDDGMFATHPPVLDLRSLCLSILRRWYGLRKKRKIDSAELLVCPECHGLLTNGRDWLSCSTCEIRYPASPIPDFNRPESIRRFDS